MSQYRDLRALQESGSRCHSGAEAPDLHDRRVQRTSPSGAVRPQLACWRSLEPAHSRHQQSAAAENLHISRAVLYDRLAKIGRLLSVDLGDANIRTSLHVALMADELR